MPQVPIHLTPKDVIRFESKFTKDEGCWNWTGAYAREYGTFWLAGRQQRTSRVAYTLYVEPIPIGLCVLHRCDNPKCVNPQHLWLGTQGDNAADSKAKGRSTHQRGELSGMAKLTTSKVLQIRKLAGQPGHSQRSLGRRFGVHHATIWLIVTGKRWGHITSMEVAKDDEQLGLFA
jgi:hypothetical protein